MFSVAIPSILTAISMPKYRNPLVVFSRYMVMASPLVVGRLALLGDLLLLVHAGIVQASDYWHMISFFPYSPGLSYDGNFE